MRINEALFILVDFLCYFCSERVRFTFTKISLCWCSLILYGALHVAQMNAENLKLEVIYYKVYQK